MKFRLHISFQLCRRLRAAFLNQVTRNRLCLSEQTYPGLLESGPDPLYVIHLQEAISSNPLNAGSTYYTQQFKLDRPAITQPQRLCDALRKCLLSALSWSVTAALPGVLLHLFPQE